MCGERRRDAARSQRRGRTFPFQAREAWTFPSTPSVPQHIAEHRRRNPGYTVRLRRSETVLSLYEKRIARCEFRTAVFLHPFVVRPAAAFGWYPGDDLVRIHDVAGLAMHAVGRIEVNLQAAGRVGGLDHLIDTGRTEVLAGVAEFLHAAFVTDVGVVNDEVRRLVFLMLGAGMIDVGKLIEGELAVAFCRANDMRLGPAISRKPVQRFHMTVPRLIGIARLQAASAGELLDACVEHAGEEPIFEALMKVAHWPKLALDPALLDAVLKRLEHLQREVVLRHAVKGSLGRQHSALDSEMNSLQPLRIQKASGIAEHHPSVSRQRRNAPPAAVGQRLRAVAHHLSAFQKLGDEGMLLEFLQYVLRVEAWIAVVE